MENKQKNPNNPNFIIFFLSLNKYALYNSYGFFFLIN